MWHSIPVPHAGTVALEQLDGTPASLETPQMAQLIATSLSGTATTPLELYLTGEKRCSYINPDGKQCGKRMAKNIVVARHWVESHAMKELKAVRSRKMSMSHAAIINTVARKLAAERYLTTCPLETCKAKGTPDADFWRLESLVRHMSNGNLHKPGKPMSDTMARNWARNNMAFRSWWGDFANGYEEAVWRIWHGY